MLCKSEYHLHTVYVIVLLLRLILRVMCLCDDVTGCAAASIAVLRKVCWCPSRRSSRSPVGPAGLTGLSARRTGVSEPGCPVSPHTWSVISVCPSQTALRSPERLPHQEIEKLPWFVISPSYNIRFKLELNEITTYTRSCRDVYASTRRQSHFYALKRAFLL